MKARPVDSVSSKRFILRKEALDRIFIAGWKPLFDGLTIKDPRRLVDLFLEPRFVWIEVETVRSDRGYKDNINPTNEQRVVAKGYLIEEYRLLRHSRVKGLSMAR